MTSWKREHQIETYSKKMMAPPVTFFKTQEGTAKSLHLDVNRDDSQVVVASSAVFIIYDIEDDRFKERVNLRGSKSQNLNYSCNDVSWNKIDSHIIATAATNGAVVLWNLGRSSRAKQEHVFIEHQRTVNKVAFHPAEANYLLSGSQDGTMKLFDTRTHEASSVFVTNAYSVRDVAFCPHGHGHLFAAGMENGHVQLWDVRRPDRYEKKWPAHSDHIFAVDWHPESKYTLASAGRDKQVKVWNTSEAKCEHTVYSIGPVGRIQWRPRYNYHLASCSGLVGDYSVSVWDIRRPYIPFAVFSEHKNVATDLRWLQDPDRLLSGGKDNLIHHAFGDCHKPALKALPAGLAWGNRGQLSYGFRDGVPTVISPYSTLAGLPEVLPKFTPSSLTPTGEPGSYNRMSSFLRRRKKTTSTSSGNSETSSPLKLRLSFGDEGCRENEANDDCVDNERPPASLSTAERDLFLTITSQLKEFRPTRDTLFSNDFFLLCAQKYMLSGATIDVLCEHNAQVCKAAKQPQIAETWRLMRILIKAPQDISDDEEDYAGAHFASGSRKGSNETSMKDSAGSENREDDPKGPRSSRSRATTESANDSKRRGSSVTSDRRYRNKNASADSGRNEHQPSEDELDEDDYAENELTLTNIASGQMLTGGICNDFFGDNEIGVSDLDLETFVSSEVSRETPLVLRNEAFEPRVPLNVDVSVNDINEDGDNNREFGEGNENDPGAEDVSNQTVIVEDQTSSLLCKESALEQSQWCINECLRSAIVGYAEVGDVQTAVSFYMVLRQAPELRHLFDESTLEFWFSCYIELLQRFKLFNEATHLIKLSPMSSISTMSQQSTTFYSNCTKCNKALSRSQGCWWCERCKKTPNLCCLCNDIVRGLFAWCQGCSHGGHLRCLKGWYSMNTLCPTGCGHHCEYQ